MKWRVSRRGLARRCRLARGKRETPCPLAAAVESDDERFIAVERLDQVQAGSPATATAVASASARPRSGPVTLADAARAIGLSRVRVDQVVAALVGTRGGDCPGEVDDLGETPRREGVGDADPEGLAGSQAAESWRCPPPRSRSRRRCRSRGRRRAPSAPPTPSRTRSGRVPRAWPTGRTIRRIARARWRIARGPRRPRPVPVRW